MENNDNFATELLHEVKTQAKRWFIAFLVMVGVEIATIAGFMWYLSLPTENVTLDGGEGYANYVGGGMSGEINNGTDKSTEKTEAQKERKGKE